MTKAEMKTKAIVITLVAAKKTAEISGKAMIKVGNTLVRISK